MPNFISSPIDKYKIVLYGKGVVAGKLVAFIHCFYNGKNVMIGSTKGGYFSTQQEPVGGRG